jgi:hypothetical protein
MVYPFVALFGKRLEYAIKSLWILLSDPVTRRRFPWKYLLRRLTRDAWIAWQLLCMTVGLLGLPLSYILSSDVQKSARISIIAIWATGLLVPPLRSRAHSR